MAASCSRGRIYSVYGISGKIAFILCGATRKLPDEIPEKISSVEPNETLYLIRIELPGKISE